MLDTSLVKDFGFTCDFFISGSITEDERYAPTRIYGNEFLIPNKSQGGTNVGTPVYEKVGSINITAREMMDLYTITENVTVIPSIGLNFGIPYYETSSCTINVENMIDTSVGTVKDVLTIDVGTMNKTLVMYETPSPESGYNMFGIRIGDITKLSYLKVE